MIGPGVPLGGCNHKVHERVRTYTIDTGRINSVSVGQRKLEKSFSGTAIHARACSVIIRIRTKDIGISLERIIFNANIKRVRRDRLEQIRTRRLEFSALRVIGLHLNYKDREII